MPSSDSIYSMGTIRGLISHPTEYSSRFLLGLNFLCENSSCMEQPSKRSECHKALEQHITSTTVFPNYHFSVLSSSLQLTTARTIPSNLTKANFVFSFHILRKRNYVILFVAQIQTQNQIFNCIHNYCIAHKTIFYRNLYSCGFQYSHIIQFTQRKKAKVHFFF